jgi:hypothetical protein
MLEFMWRGPWKLPHMFVQKKAPNPQIHNNIEPKSAIVDRDGSHDAHNMANFFFTAWPWHKGH